MKFGREMVNSFLGDKHVLEWHPKGLLVDEKLVVPDSNIVFVELK